MPLWPSDGDRSVLMPGATGHEGLHEGYRCTGLGPPGPQGRSLGEPRGEASRDVVIRGSSYLPRAERGYVPIPPFVHS